MKYLASLLCLLALSASAQTVLNVSNVMYVGSITVVDTTAPSITADPGSLVKTNGQSATFTVTASGTSPLAYQWQKNSTNLASATTTSYAIASVTNADAGSYRCVVTNAYGSATSAVATLTVYDEYTPPNTNIVSDNFNRASLGAAWQVTEGGWTIVSNTLASWTNAPNGNTILYTNQAVSSANQWVLVTPQNAGSYSIVHLRHTVGSGSYYQLQFNNPTFYWKDDANNTIGTAELTWSATTPIGVTLTGTGASTVLRIFPNGSTNGPSSATVWSGSTTNVAITNAGTYVVNSGTIVGLGAYYNGPTPPALSFDDFFAGGL